MSKLFTRLRGAPKFPYLEKGNVSPTLSVPSSIRLPPYVNNKKFDPTVTTGFDISPTTIKNEVQISAMRRTGKLAAQILDYATSLVKEGITTDEIDKKVHEAIISEGAYPSPLLYRGFPKSICTSINECLAHGIPDDRPLRDGDIINIDITVYKEGVHGDTSRTVYLPVNENNANKQERDELCLKVLNATRRAMDNAIKICAPNVPFREIAKVIDKVCEEEKLSCIPYLTGHGIGEEFHEDPIVLHTRKNHRETFKGEMKAGMVFTIEPILVPGSIEMQMWSDKWTLVSEDKSISAQFEHTILITDNGFEVLTLSK